MKTTFSLHNFLTIFCLTLLVGLLMRGLEFPYWESFLVQLFVVFITQAWIGPIVSTEKNKDA